jgi:hypothetical protein
MVSVYQLFWAAWRPLNSPIVTVLYGGLYVVDVMCFSEGFFEAVCIAVNLACMLACT